MSFAIALASCHSRESGNPFTIYDLALRAKQRESQIVDAKS
jgi:hypothetical protein